MANDSKMVVLVADDEPSTRAMVSNHLRSKGYRVLEAADGDEAWELAHEHLPHLVVLDVMMPGMSGWEVCRKIREAVSLAHTGVVMLTGIGENLNEMTSPLYGADAYVDKPFEFAVLDERVHETLARRHGEALRLAEALRASGRNAGARASSAREPAASKSAKPVAQAQALANAPAKPERAPRTPAKAKAKARKPAKAKARKPAKAKARKPAKAKARKPAKAKARKPTKAKARKPTKAKAKRKTRAAPARKGSKRRAKTRARR
jgi:DNA-binding response OmpR family regulator